MRISFFICPQKHILCCASIEYRIYCEHLDRHAWTNSADPDEMPQNAASHQGLHYLPLIQQFLGLHYLPPIQQILGLHYLPLI